MKRQALTADEGSVTPSGVAMTMLWVSDHPANSDESLCCS
jgi:hypothetical protein